MNHAHRAVCLTAMLGLNAIALLGADGLKGEYFNNTGLVGKPIAVRTDPFVDFSWAAAPIEGVSANNFSVRWTGQVEAPVTGSYRFITSSNNGVRLWLNNVLIIDDWTVHSTKRDVSGHHNLTAGQKYQITLQFYENTGTATAQLAWSYPGQTETVIPQMRLTSPDADALPKPLYLSDLTPTVSINGWGPYERDQSNGETGGSDGSTISLAGIKFPKGLGVHAQSELRYALGGKYKTFSAKIGVDDEVGLRGSVVFQVWTDGVKQFESDVLHGADKIRIVTTDLAGKNELKLMVLSASNGNSYDHADWADAYLSSTSGTPDPIPTTPPPPAAPAAPSGLTATPGNQKVMLAWNAMPGSPGATFNVYRRTSSVAEAAVSTGLAVPNFIDSGLTNGTTYIYRVAAIVSGVTGAKSADASAKPEAPTPAAPTGLTATPGNQQVTLAWNAMPGTPGATFNVYRRTSSVAEAAVSTGLAVPSFTDNGLTNGTTYIYRVAAIVGGVTGAKSADASAKPEAPTPAAPSGLTATPGNQLVTLAWNAMAGATFNVYRRTSSVAEASVSTGLTVPNFTDSGLTNGTTYIYRVAAIVAGVTGPKSADASAKPVAPPAPAAPIGLTAIPGNGQIILSWNSSAGASSYNLYRGTAANGESATPIMTGMSVLTITDPGLVNGTTYFYKVAAVSSAGTGSKSSEASATPTAPGLLLTDAQKDAFRFLRQSTWGPNSGLVDHVVQVGKPAFLDEQFIAPASDYPADLITKPNMELVSERFFQNGIQGQDQLRQRVAWALSEIFVVSAVKVDNTHAMVPYIKMLHARAFDNVKDIMRDVSLSPAMGEFLDMVNNKKADPTKGTFPNENYAREWLQLMSIGLQELNDDGTPVLDSKGVPTVTYVQSDIADLARVLTGWTYGDTKTTNPTRLNEPFYDGPMKPIDRYHDTGQKTVMGKTFLAGQTGQQDFDQALDMVFNHHNVGPFLVRELIQRLVTSNPSKTYIRDVVGVFNDNGQGVRGDLKAVVKAILLHPEAVNGTPTSGKFSEPALFLLTLSRALNASVVDHPFMTDFSQDMSQQIWFAPSIFNYFSPNYRAGNLFAPEMQIWTTATAMSRTNFVASLISGGFGKDVTINTAPFTSVAPDTNALVDTVNSLIMGGTMGNEMRQAILTALAATKSTSERVRTALYLTATSMQYQVEH